MITLLLITQDVNEVKFVADFCKENEMIFFFIKNEKKAKKFLLNEKITVSIINSNVIKKPEDFITELREQDCNTSLIYIGNRSFNKVRKLLKMGYYDYLTFNYDKESLFASIDEAIVNRFTFEKIKNIAEELEKTNERLLKKTNELLEEKNTLREYINMMTQVDIFSKEINSEKNLDGILFLVIKYLEDRFNKNIILFTLIENMKETVALSSGISINSVKDYEWDLNDLTATPWAVSIMENKNTVKVKHPLEDAWYSKSNIVNIFPNGFIKIPLYTGKKVYGTITISMNTAQEDFTQEDEFYMNLIAEHTSISIENIKLKESLEKVQKKMIEHEKFEAITKLAVSVNHEINNPLCAISLNIEILKRRLTNQENLKIISIIENNIEKIYKTTNKIGQLKKITTMEYIPGIDMIDIENSS